MNSFSNYTQNNNCEQRLKDSTFFSLYHKKTTKQFFFKSNNNIKGFYKDPILNDFIYFASNGLKKNAIFRRNELQDGNYENNFVSYFRNIEDQLLIFNIYPQKYNADLISKQENIKSLFKNIYIKNSKRPKSKSFFIHNYPLMRSQPKGNYFLRNYYDTHYFCDDRGFIKQINNKVFRKNLFSGLLYIFPKKIQKAFKSLFSMNYLLTGFYNNLLSLKDKNKVVKTNILLYFLYLKFTNHKIRRYLRTKKLRMRKSNWYLRRYIYLYSNQLVSITNFFYSMTSKRMNSSKVFLLNKLTWEKSVFNRIPNAAMIIKNSKNIDRNTKLNFLKAILTFLMLNYKNTGKLVDPNTNLLANYLNSKAISSKGFLNYLSKKGLEKRFNLPFNNHFINLSNNITNNKPNLYNQAPLLLYDELLSEVNKGGLKRNVYYLSKKLFSRIVLKKIIRFKKIDERNKIVPYVNVTPLAIFKPIIKNISKLTRSIQRWKKNKLVFKKITKVFTAEIKAHKIAQIKSAKKKYRTSRNKLRAQQKRKLYN